MACQAHDPLRCPLYFAPRSTTRHHPHSVCASRTACAPPADSGRSAAALVRRSGSREYPGLGRVPRLCTSPSSFGGATRATVYDFLRGPRGPQHRGRSPRLLGSVFSMACRTGRSGRHTRAPKPSFARAVGLGHAPARAHRPVPCGGLDGSDHRLSARLRSEFAAGLTPKIRLLRSACPGQPVRHRFLSPSFPIRTSQYGLRSTDFAVRTSQYRLPSTDFPVRPRPLPWVWLWGRNSQTCWPLCGASLA